MLQKYGIDPERKIVLTRIRRCASRSIQEAWPLKEVFKEEALETGYPVVVFMRYPLYRMQSLYVQRTRLMPGVCGTYDQFADMIVEKDLANTDNAHFVKVSDVIDGFDTKLVYSVNEFGRVTRQLSRDAGLESLRTLGRIGAQDYEPISAKEADEKLKAYYKEDHSLYHTVLLRTTSGDY
jgi:hypothetical protein